MTFVVYLLGALQVAAFAVAIASRLWVLKPDPIIWRGIDTKVAATNVQSYFIDIDDGRWAYPTGMFIPDESSQPELGKVVMRENDFKGSRGLGWAWRIFEWGFRGAAVAVAAGAETGVFGFFMGAFLAMFWLGAMAMLAVPFVFYSVLDMIFRPLMRSRIEATVTKHPEVEDAVQINLTFRGLSAFGLVSDAVTGLTAPKLPPSFSASALGLEEEVAGNTTAVERAAGWVKSADRRYHVVLGSGVASALIVAALLTAFAPLTQSVDGGYLATDTESASASESDYSSDGSSSDSDGTEETENAYSGDGFSIEPIADWVPVNEGEDRGAFTEWRWEPTDRDDIYMVVHATAGFDGTAEEGARGVRNGVEQDPTYSEMDFRAEGDAWTWEFELDGERKIDQFVSACGTGWALLYAAPADEFDLYSSNFDSAFESFTPDCEQSDGVTGDESDTDDGRVDHIADQKFDASTPEGKAERTIRRHWQARLDGDYSKAYRLYADPVRSRVGTESNWSESIAEDGLNSVEFGGVRAQSISSTGGNMVVRLTTESDMEGCVSWRFIYTVNEVSGRWRITDTTATKSSC